MTNVIIDNNFLPEVTGGHPTGQVGTTHSSVDGKLRNSVRDLLGDKAQLHQFMSLGDLDYHEGAAHSTTSLPYAIHGTATVINKRVATWLAGFQDPIKAILGVGVHRDKKIIIKRKYVVGGQTTITPERAPARTVAIKEDAREVLLTRYGGDLEMNLNLFLRPELAREELEMKIGAQREQLEQTLVDIGYETVMEQGTNIMAALNRASPATSALSTSERRQLAERIYIQSIFGAMAKHPYPVQNLLAAASKANLYTPAGSAPRAGYSVLIVPPGMELNKYTKAEEMVFSISGLNKNEHGSISMPLSNAMQDTSSNLRILVHVPPAGYRQGGAAHPEVEGSGLSELVGWGTYYPVPVKKDDGNVVITKMRITDFKKRNWVVPDISDAILNKYKAFNAKYTEYIDGLGEDDNPELILVRPKMVAMMSSCILCTKPGKETGELLMAYPATGISTSQTTETMKMQLRVYMGAVIYEPENLLILPNVQFEGCVAGHGSKICESQFFDPQAEDLIIAFKTKGTDLHDIFEDEIFRETAGEVFYKEYLDMRDAGDLYGKDEPMGQSGRGFNTEDGVPLSLYQGTTMIQNASQQWVLATENVGHLGCLDSPACSDRLDGIQKFTPNPNPINLGNAF